MQQHLQRRKATSRSRDLRVASFVNSKKSSIHWVCSQPALETRKETVTRITDLPVIVRSSTLLLKNSIKIYWSIFLYNFWVVLYCQKKWNHEIDHSRLCWPQSVINIVILVSGSSFLLLANERRLRSRMSSLGCNLFCSRESNFPNFTQFSYWPLACSMIKLTTTKGPHGFVRKAPRYFLVPI